MEVKYVAERNHGKKQEYLIPLTVCFMFSPKCAVSLYGKTASENVREIGYICFILFPFTDTDHCRTADTKDLHV